MQSVSVQATAQPATVLVVEDEVIVRALIAEVLRDHGLMVVETATGEEAWSYLLSGAAVDLVFTDNNLHGSVSGVKLAELVGKHMPEVSVVITSGHIPASDYAGPFIPKPYDMEAVAQRLNAMCWEKVDGRFL